MSNQIEAEDARKKKKKKSSSKKKRRFSDEQIRLLESIFESESKLEPRKKLQLAGELGLQPRQVAIWFQNRRARWKSKQIEQEYTALKANYEKLASCLDSLKNEKQSLLMELQKLNKLLGQPCEGKGPCKDSGESNTALIASDYQGNIIKSEPEAKQELDNRKFLCSSDKIKFYGDERHQLLSSDEYADEHWHSLDSGSQFDLSSSSSQWLNFWT